MSVAAKPAYGKPQADLVVDASDLVCPGPVIEAKRAVSSGVEIGQVVQLISTDPGTPADLTAWASRTGHELVTSDVGPGGSFHFWIRRRK
jgi:tRNA 2-thiouridine synthesizing protein A